MLPFWPLLNELSLERVACLQWLQLFRPFRAYAHRNRWFKVLLRLPLASTCREFPPVASFCVMGGTPLLFCANRSRRVKAKRLNFYYRSEHGSVSQSREIAATKAR